MVGKMRKRTRVENDQKEGDKSLLVTRFFKIMHGKDCSEVMYLPPKFARHVKDLAGQKTQIEDVSRRKWTVKFSYVDGALAFLEGWHKFFVDHQLEYGEILFFNYTRHGRFVVHVHGLSACEIISFNRRSDQPNKRLRIDKKIFSQDEPCQVIGANSMNQPNSTPSVSSGQKFHNRQDHPTTTNALHSVNGSGNLCFSTSKYMEDPSCTVHRDSGCYQGEDRKILFDLSRFEKGENSFDAYRRKTFLGRTVTSVETQFLEQIKAKRSDPQISMACKIQSANHSCNILSDAPHAKISCNSDSGKDMPKNAPIFQTGNNHVFPADIEPPDIACNQLAEKEDVLEPKHRYSSVSSSMPKYSLGKLNGVTKKEVVELSVSSSMPKYSLGKLNGVTKKEVVELGDEDYGFRQVTCGNNHVLPADVESPPVVLGNKHGLPVDIESPDIASSQLVEKEDVLEPKHHYSSVSRSKLKYSLGKLNDVTQKELVELGDEDYGFPQVPCGNKSRMIPMCGQMPSSTVKTEPALYDDFVPAVSGSSFTAEVKSQSFLELPHPISSIPGRRNRGSGAGAKVVYLKDSTERLWPVLFPETLFVKAFTDGWKTFCKGNCISVGDECRIQNQSYIPCIYKVDIIHRAGRSRDN